jgi:hypothetical protein
MKASTKKIVMGLLAGAVVLVVAAASGKKKKKKIRKAFEVKPLTEAEAQKALEESNQGELIGRRE